MRSPSFATVSWPTLLLALLGAGALALGYPSALLGAGLTLLLAPGYLVRRLIWPGAALPWLTELAVSIALSMGALSIVVLWCSTIGISVAPLALQAAPLLLLGAVAGSTLWQGTGGWRPGRWDGATLAVLALIVATRAAQARGLAFPPWVDGVHHALLVRVAFERGGVPFDLTPYLPIARLPYHWGYHVWLAAALRGAGARVPDDLPGGLLVAGQLLNSVVALAWGGAAAYLWRRPAAGVAAAVAVGLVSFMPAYYLSWSRYTLLMGVTALPGALILLHLLFSRGAAADGTATGWRRAALVGLAMAGLACTHIVALCLAALWALALLPLRFSRSAALWLGAASVLAAALCWPWLALLLGQASATTGSAATNAIGNAGYNGMPWALLWAATNRLVLASAALGALLLLRRRAADATLVLCWCLLALLLANPAALRLPYISFFTNEFVAITLFGPASLLIGGGAAALERWLEVARWPGWARSLPLLALLLVAAVWGAAGTQTIVRPDTVNSTEADLRAIEWARANTPADARFMVASAPWLYDVLRGGDGGWWLLPLAGRQTSVPPVVFNAGGAAYVAEVKRQAAWVLAGGGRAPTALAAEMRRAGYGYVYATDRGTTLDRAALAASPLFEVVYSEGDVTIFRLAPS